MSEPKEQEPSIAPPAEPNHTTMDCDSFGRIRLNCYRSGCRHMQIVFVHPQKETLEQITEKISRALTQPEPNNHNMRDGGDDNKTGSASTSAGTLAIAISGTSEIIPIYSVSELRHWDRVVFIPSASAASSSSSSASSLPVSSLNNETNKTPPTKLQKQNSCEEPSLNEITENDNSLVGSEISCSQHDREDKTTKADICTSARHDAENDDDDDESNDEDEQVYRAGQKFFVEIEEEEFLVKIRSRGTRHRTVWVDYVGFPNDAGELIETKELEPHTDEKEQLFWSLLGRAEEGPMNKDESLEQPKQETQSDRKRPPPVAADDNQSSKRQSKRARSTTSAMEKKKYHPPTSREGVHKLAGHFGRPGLFLTDIEESRYLYYSRPGETLRHVSKRFGGLDVGKILFDNPGVAEIPKSKLKSCTPIVLPMEWKGKAVKLMQRKKSGVAAVAIKKEK